MSTCPARDIPFLRIAKDMYSPLPPPPPPPPPERKSKVFYKLGQPTASPVKERDNILNRSKSCLFALQMFRVKQPIAGSKKNAVHNQGRRLFKSWCLFKKLTLYFLSDENFKIVTNQTVSLLSPFVRLSVKLSGFQNPRKFCLKPEIRGFGIRNGIQLKKNGISLTIRFRNPSSTDKKFNIQYLESGIDSVGSPES